MSLKRGDMLSSAAEISCDDQHIQTFRSDYLEAMRKGSGRMADKVVETALNSHLTANEIYLQVFQPTAYEIGAMWQRNEFSIAQEHLATAIIERQMGDMHTNFKPVRDRTRRLVIGAVDNEQHRVGIRMVADFFEQDGWDVYYLGAAVPVNTFLFIAREFKADLVGVSAQMVYHLPHVENFVRGMDAAGMSGVPIMAGGFPFVNHPGLYQSLGVHFSGVDAQQALTLANRIVD